MTEGHVVGPRFVSTALLLLWLARASSAQAVPSAPPLGDLLIPGGAARLFHAASLSPPRDRAYALLTLSRLLYQEPIGGNRALDGSAARLRDYLDVLGQWSIRATPFSKGIALREARARAMRRPLEDLLAFLGLVIEERGGTFLVERHSDPDAPRRRAALSAAGMDLDAFERTLNAGETVDVSIPGDTVPLPLTETTWLRTIFENRVPAAAMFALIIGEREALWLYCGLLGLDSHTRRFIESEPELLAWIHRTRPALFGAFGRSLRVRAGRVETPGGARDRALWESLAGVPTTEPVRFVRSLLEGDAGRLAWFYDTVAHLPPDRQAIVAGPSGNDSAARLAWFRSLYSVFLAFNPSWDVSVRPFVRRPLDPTLALHLVEMWPDGRVAGPRWTSFWEQAFTTGGLPDHPPEAFKHLDSDESASLPSVLGKVFAGPTTEHRALFDLVLFAGRVFSAIDQAHAFDALVASRGFMRFPALMLLLEHTGVTDPEVYAEAARAAALISASAGARTLVVRTVQFQAALALLDRLREVRALDVPGATMLARALFRARPASDGWYDGAIVSWLDLQVLPALGIAEGAEPVEARLMMALAGMPRVPGAPTPVVEWQGQRYRVDLARAVLARLLPVRDKQRGPDLDAILTAWRRVAATATTAVAGARGTESAAPGFGVDRLGTREASTLLGSPMPDSEPLRRKVDWATAEWLASLAYAVRIENVDAPVLLAVNPALTHDLRLLTPRLGEIGETAWTIPAVATGSGRRAHLEGSLLGLALPLSPYAVTRVKTEIPAHPPTVPGNDAELLMASAAAFNPMDVTDEERDVIAGALRRGRARIAALPGEPAGWDSIADALSADEWERQLIPWMLAQEPDRVFARFPAHDLFVLGDERAPGRADHWGMLAQPIDGSLFLRLPTPALRRVLANQNGVGALVTQFCDLHFRVAEFLADSRLPASLGRGLLAIAVPEFLERALLSHDNDWPGLVVAASAMTDEGFAQYVSTLTANGPLVRHINPPASAIPAPETRCPSRRCP